jgi:hypothetical protein
MGRVAMTPVARDAATPLVALAATVLSRAGSKGVVDRAVRAAPTVPVRRCTPRR